MQKKILLEITSRTSSFGHHHPYANDPGGRIGPYTENGRPDLRNFYLYVCPCTEDDFVIVVSNGVTDNFDAEYLGLSPREVSSKITTINSLLLPTVSQASLNDDDPSSLNDDLHSDHKKLNGINPSEALSNTLQEGIHKELPDSWDEMDPIPKSILKRQYMTTVLSQKIQAPPRETVREILDYCSETTKARRKYLKQYPNRMQPRDYKTYPGILDHATCFCIEVKRGPRT